VITWYHTAASTNAADQAHHLAYHLAHPDTPLMAAEGSIVRTCNNARCVRVEHLVTAAESAAAAATGMEDEQPHKQTAQSIEEEEEKLDFTPLPLPEGYVMGSLQESITKQRKESQQADEARMKAIAEAAAGAGRSIEQELELREQLRREQLAAHMSAWLRYSTLGEPNRSQCIDLSVKKELERNKKIREWRLEMEEKYPEKHDAASVLEGNMQEKKQQAAPMEE
jgi:hypothetical protein